jgi:hypothetical protein
VCPTLFSARILSILIPYILGASCGQLACTCPRKLIRRDVYATTGIGQHPCTRNAGLHIPRLLDTSAPTIPLWTTCLRPRVGLRWGVRRTDARCLLLLEVGSCWLFTRFGATNGHPYCSRKRSRGWIKYEELSEVSADPGVTQVLAFSLIHPQPCQRPAGMQQTVQAMLTCIIEWRSGFDRFDTCGVCVKSRNHWKNR